MEDWRKELRSRLIVIVRGVYSEVETGEPYCQPQPYALAACLDCQEALRLLIEEDISEDSVEFTLMAIRQAAECNRSDLREEEWLATADRVEKGWQQGDFARGVFRDVSAVERKEIDSALSDIEMQEFYYGHLTKEERAAEKARISAEIDGFLQTVGDLEVAP